MALTTVPVSLSATALTLTTAAQPNITSVGTLTGLTVSGNIAGTLTTAAQTNITSLGTLTSLTVDDITINGSTISDGGTLTLDAASELHLDADDGIIRIRDAGGDYGMFQISNSDFIIRSMVGDKDLIFRGNDGGSVITALTLDMSAAGKAVFNAGADFHNVVDISAGTNLNLSVRQLAFDNFSNEGVGITFSRTSSDADLMAIGVVDTSKLNFASREGIIFSTGGGVQYGATSEVMRIDGSGNVGIGTPSPAQTLHVSSTGATSNGIRISNSEGSFETRVDGGEFYLYDVDDTRIPFLIDSSGRTGMGTTSPSSYYSKNLVVMTDGDGTGGITLVSPDTDDAAYICFADGTSGAAKYAGYLGYSHASTENMFLGVGGSTKMTIRSDGLVAIGSNHNPTHSLHALSTDNKAFLLDRNTANEPASLNEFSSYYALSIKNRASGSYLNFGGGGAGAKIQATDGAGSATAKYIILQPYGGLTTIGGNVAPTAALTVIGDSGTQGSVRIVPDSGKGSEVSHIHYGGTGDWYIRSASTSGKVIINDAGGNVGIGTTSPTEALEVAGNVKLTGSSRLLLPNFWIGPVPNTANNNNGAVLLVNLSTINASNVGFQFSGSIIGNSYTGQAFVNVNIVKHYSNDNVAFDVADDQNLNSTVTRMQLNLCTVTYSGNSYLAIVKNGGGTGTIYLNGYFQGWYPSQVTEVTSGNYTITTNHGNLNF